MADAPDANQPFVTEQPKVDAKTGLGMVGDYPANHRLRAEALVNDGKAEDPDGHITPELIADTKVRLAGLAKDAEAREAAARAAQPSETWKKDDLIEHAEGLGVAVEPGATKAEILDTIHDAAPAAEAQG